MIIKKLLRVTLLLSVLFCNGVAKEALKEISFKNRQDFYINSGKNDTNRFYFYDKSQRFVQLQENSRLRLWSVEDKQPIKVFEKFGYIGKVSGSEDGRYLLIHSVLDYVDSLKLFDTKEERLITLDSKSQVEGSSYRTDMSKDGKYLIFTEGDCSQRVVKVWDIEKIKLVSKFSTHIKEGILAVKISPNNNFIVTHSRENSIDIWSIEGKHLKHIQLDKSIYNGGGIDITQDEKSILTGKNIIDVEKGKVVSILNNRGIIHNTNTFNPLNDNEIICFVKEKKQNLIEVLNWKEHKIVATFDTNLTHYQSDFSFNGNFLFIYGAEKLYLFDLKSKKVVHTVEDIGINGWYDNYGFQTTLDNKNLLYFNSKEELLLIDIRSKKVVKKMNRGKKLKRVNKAILSGNKKYLAMNLGDGNISIWDINRSQSISTFVESKDGFNCLMTLDSTGEYLVSLDDSVIKVWNAFKGELLETYKFDDDSMFPDDLFLTSNNRYLIWYGDKKTKVWDMQEEEFISTEFKVNREKLFFNDKILVSIFENRRVLLYDIENMKIPMREFVMAKDNSWLGIDNIHHKIYQGGRGIPLFHSEKNDLGRGVSLSPFYFKN